MLTKSKAVKLTATLHNVGIDEPFVTDHNGVLWVANTVRQVAQPRKFPLWSEHQTSCARYLSF